MERTLYDLCCINDERRVNIILNSSFTTPEQIQRFNLFRDELALQQSILHVACVWNNDRLVESLWRAGFDLHVGNAYGDTPLHFAALFGKLRVAEKLVNLGAEVGRSNHRRATPLHYATAAAVMSGQLATLDFLVAKGAKILTDGDGLTPLDLAIIGGKMDLIDRLLAGQDYMQTQEPWQTLGRLLLRQYTLDDDKGLVMAAKLLQHVWDSSNIAELLFVVLLNSMHRMDVTFQNISRVLKSPFYPLPDGVHTHQIAMDILRSVEAVF